MNGLRQSVFLVGALLAAVVVAGCSFNTIQRLPEGAAQVPDGVFSGEIAITDDGAATATGSSGTSIGEAETATGNAGTSGEEASASSSASTNAEATQAGETATDSDSSTQAGEAATDSDSAP